MMTRSVLTSRTALGFEAPTALVTEPPTGGGWWETTKEVLKTGAEIFGVVYPAIKGTGYPSPYPQTPPVYRPGIPGVPGYSQAGIVRSSPNWLLPVVAGVGGILLITMMGKRR